MSAEFDQQLKRYLLQSDAVVITREHLAALERMDPAVMLIEHHKVQTLAQIHVAAQTLADVITEYGHVYESHEAYEALRELLEGAQP